VQRFCGSIGCWPCPAARLRYMLLDDPLFLHVRIFKSRTQEETVRIDRKDESGYILATRPQSGRADFLVLSSLSPHTVQQIFDSFTHEPSVLARQDVGRQDPWACKARRCIDSSPCAHHM
jgi:hypothetical protein